LFNLIKIKNILLIVDFLILVKVLNLDKDNKKIPLSKTKRDYTFIFYFKNQHIYNMLLEYLAIFQGDNSFPEGKN